MPIPSKNKLGKPILLFLNDEKYHTIVDLTDYLAEIFHVTNDEREELTSVAHRPKFDIKVRWAVSELRQALLLENLRLGVFKITERGLKVLKNDPIQVDPKFLKKFPEFRDWIENKDNIKKISKKTEKEKIKKKFGLVAYVDVLGTREMWKNSNPEDMPKIWNQFTKKFHDILELTIKDKTIPFTFNSFSDTIIITIEHPDVNYLLTKFGVAVWDAIVRSIELDIPVRGCFSIGNFYHEGNFFIGEAIAEAAQYYELPQWIGISASPSANVVLEKISKKIPSIHTYYHKCPIPLKNSIEQEAWTIKWPELYETMRIANESKKTTPYILDIIDSKLEEIKNIDIALKWRNTRKFFDDIVIHPPQSIESQF